MGTPTIGGDTTDTTFEDGLPAATGDLDDANGNTSNSDDMWAITAQGQYGVATINADGTWTYDLDESDPTVSALLDGETLTDVFTVTMSDMAGIGSGETDTQDITITIIGLPCFAGDTLIQTEQGMRPVRDIAVGQRVMTPSGPRAVTWAGSRTVTPAELAANPKLRPIRITKGALGNGLPERDLLVSRQHRMMVRSKIARRMFGEAEVLVPAVALTDLPGIFVDCDVSSVEYVHLLFSSHEIVLAEGAPSESLYTGPEALNALPAEAREEILTLMPQLADHAHRPVAARHIPSAKQQKTLISRHHQNDSPVLTAKRLGKGRRSA